jgi:hypothetical protein
LRRRQRPQAGGQPPLDGRRVLAGQRCDLLDAHPGQPHERQRLAVAWRQTVERRGRRRTADAQAHGLRDERTARRSGSRVAHDALGHGAGGVVVGGRLAGRAIDPREVVQNPHSGATYGARRRLASTERMILRSERRERLVGW